MELAALRIKVSIFIYLYLFNLRYTTAVPRTQRTLSKGKSDKIPYYINT
jgi:hypothetical protein